MKRSFFISWVVVLIWNVHCFALLRIGAKAGVNLANVSATNSSTHYTVKPGFAAGLMAELPMSPGGMTALRGELLYVQKGAKSSQAGVDGKVLIDEFVIAPFLVFYLPAPQIKPFLEAGPEFGWNTLAKSQEDSVTKNLGPQWKRNNFSMNLGAGVLFPAGAGDVVLDARYNFGLSDLTLGGGDIRTKTNGIQVFLGYNFFKL